MAEIRPALFAFDHGIERLLEDRPGGETALPERLDLSPSEEQLRPRLDEVVRPRSFDERLQDFLRPRVADREILAPARFGGLLDSALDKLRLLAPEDDPVMREAVEVLAEEQALRQLLDSYRNLLVKG
jgi:hypothetical protein